jgi:excisionase family DNA binding protein
MKKIIIEKLSVEELKLIITQTVEHCLKYYLGQHTDEFLTITEASGYLKIPVTTLYDYTSNKKIPFHKKGKTLHFSKQELTAWMKQKQKKEVSHEVIT